MRLAQDFAFCSDWIQPTPEELAKAKPKAKVKIQKNPYAELAPPVPFGWAEAHAQLAQPAPHHYFFNEAGIVAQAEPVVEEVIEDDDDFEFFEEEEEIHDDDF